ncbi:MAG: hypothetical protein K9J82_07895 [Methylotenera sp.]|jgi:hypothetical protein|nr:hypothetical protein [Methylotenera sp.]
MIQPAHRPACEARRLRVPFAAALGLWLCAQAAVAGARLPPVQPLQNGVNRVALLAGAPAGMAVLAHRENFNAHGFDVLTLYQPMPSVRGEPASWQIVPAFDAQGEHLTLAASGGADCLLRDFRLLQPVGRSGATLIIAERALGDSYASPAPVTFRFYRLRRNDAGEVGRPGLYFEFDHEQTSAQPHCDVGEAFGHVLGLKDYRRK